jgi:hypothetical protein
MISVLFPSVMVTSLFVSILVAEAILAVEPSSNFNLAEAFKSTSCLLSSASASISIGLLNESQLTAPTIIRDMDKG